MCDCFTRRAVLPPDESEADASLAGSDNMKGRWWGGSVPVKMTSLRVFSGLRQGETAKGAEPKPFGPDDALKRLLLNCWRRPVSPVSPVSPVN